MYKIMSLEIIHAQINLLKNAAKAKLMMRYFKTGPGSYGQGDVFAGLSNPECREIAASNKTATLEDIGQLLTSKIHQQRFIGLVLMDHKFKKPQNEEQIYLLYLQHIKSINNWDLVDLSAPNIMGKYIFKRCQTFTQIVSEKDPRNILYQLVNSPIIWLRRISILSTLTFIRQNQFYDTLKLSEMLLGDKEDLIHKAVGWMLRQVGKRQQNLLESFLKQNYIRLPRTALRYAIQRFPETKRQIYLKGTFEKDI